jgi:NAD(P) transhydrogenase subunit alpha
MASLSSQLYSATVVALVEEMRDKETGELQVDYDNEVIRGALVTHDGKITYPPPTPPPAPEPGVASKPAPKVSTAVAKSAHGGHEAEGKTNPLWLALAGIALVGIGLVAPASTLSHFTVFMLACFVGWQVVWSVKPALHTPLMSVTNAISGIILVGGMLQLSGVNFNLTTILGAIAVLIATINIAGGFLVTNRMLAMFRK